jgi:hypothetical protein
MRHKRFVLAAGVACLATWAAIPSSASAAVACPYNNIAVILDDSGSMAGFDPNRLRTQAIKILLNKPANQRKTMSALEFGSDAAAIFPPGPIASQRGIMSAALDQAIQANNGATDYNDAFALRKTQNPNANRIIFLTDGGHNIGAFANGHQGGPPVDVVGFGSSIVGADGARLQQIANETKGTYFPGTDANNLQSIINKIDSVQNCGALPVEWLDTILNLNDRKSHSTNIAGSTRAVDIVVSWGNANDSFDITNIRVTSKGRTVGIAKRRKKKARKLKVKRVGGTTFQTLRITRVKRGKLKFKLKPKKLGTPGVPVQVTTQLTQSRTR